MESRTQRIRGSLVSGMTCLLVLLALYGRTMYIHENGIVVEDLLFGLPRIAAIAAVTGGLNAIAKTKGILSSALFGAVVGPCLAAAYIMLFE